MTTIATARRRCSSCFPCRWPGRTVTVEPLRGGARQTLTQDDLPGDCLPLTGPNAKYTVAADLQGEDGAVYHAQYVFIFRKEAS